MFSDGPYLSAATAGWATALRERCICFAIAVEEHYLGHYFCSPHQRLPEFTSLKDRMRPCECGEGQGGIRPSSGYLQATDGMNSYGLTAAAIFLFVTAASCSGFSAAPAGKGGDLRPSLPSLGVTSRYRPPAIKTFFQKPGGSREPTVRIESLKSSGKFRIHHLDDVNGSQFASYPPSSGLKAASKGGTNGIFYEPREVGNSSTCSNTSDSGRCQSFGRPDSQFKEISHQGGNVMTGRVNVYLIYYGNWGQGMGQDVFENFIASLTDASADSLVSKEYKQPDEEHPSKEWYQ